MSCGDDGIISGWEGSPFDLRARDDGPADERTVGVTTDVADVLRTIVWLDAACERMVFGARTNDGSILLDGTDDDLETLIDAVAAEGNHEPSRRRQQRLDAAYDALARAT